jgi:large subunit ribosomal protein L18
MRIDKKLEVLQKRRYRIRKKVKGTQACPRLSVKFTNQHIHSQCIDDETGVTLVAWSSLSKKSSKGQDRVKPNMEGAILGGKTLGQLAKKKGIERVVFDRNGRRYHGTVKAFADAAREFLSF